MKSMLRLLIGGTVLTAAGALVLPEDATGWSTIGGNLNLTQRDFRIYDNFTDTAAHNNTTADPNWSGYTEIELACWKGGAEWGARAFGNGSGDPLQTNVGDGGANFNFFWNGNASAVGGVNANINSELVGSSGGVLAYTETPISDGWRIRYYSSWTWHDGPGSVSGGIDLQGVACHELGHALGLGHTNVGGSTMYPSISGTGTSARSIESDDINGVRAVYGVRSSTMPEITSLQGSTAAGGTMVIMGSNFSATGNEVWFNNSLLDDQQAGGEPTKLTNVSSTSGGTQISVTVPSSGIEQGGVHVRSNGTGHSNLSEGEPFNYGGQVGTNTITMTGPNVGWPGAVLTYNYAAAPANGAATLLYSLTNTGSTYNNHPLDIGSPYTTAANGTSSATGTGSFTVTVPAGAPTITVYVEMVVVVTSVVADSNVIALSIT